MLPNRPKDAHFLTQAEKDWMNEQIKREEEHAIQETGHASAWKAMKNIRVWHLAIAAMIFTNATIWMNFWLPSLIKVLAHSRTATNVGLLVAIPMIFGLIGMQVISRHSDKTQERVYHVAVPNILGGIALFVVFLGHGANPLLLSMIMLTVMVIGIDNFYGTFWSLPSGFLTGYAAASGIALISTVANLTGFVGPWFIGWVNGKTGSLFDGVAIIGGCLIVSSLMLILFKDRGKAEV
jgi:ACS family tartrate transporter-like MFS transporter